MKGDSHFHVHVHANGTAHNHYHSHAVEGADGKGAHDAAHSTATNTETPIHKAQGTTILEAVDLAYYYRAQDTPVFKELCLEAKSGSTLAVLGNNGAGKSTLLSILAGLAQPSHGVVTVLGSNLLRMSLKERARHVAYVSQEGRVPHLSVYDQVLLGRRPHLGWQISEYDRLVVSGALEQLGLEGFANRYVDELSGGERQKVQIARALAQEPEVLLLDEPTSALDPKNQMEVLEIVRNVTSQSALATILVMHDINLALRFGDRFLLMHNGEIVAYGESEVVSSETLSKTYDYDLKLVTTEGARLALPAVL